MPLATAERSAATCGISATTLVITFDREGLGAIVCENHDQLYGVIQRWMEKNAPYIEYVSPIEKALTEDPIQAMFCGPVGMMRHAPGSAFWTAISPTKSQSCERSTIIAI